jgi:transglutaminase-like putative cysteine protease
MYYSIRHLTKFLYSNPVSESMMETRMHPRSDQNQRCLTFHLSVSPRCRVFSYRDHLANQVHHFDIPGQHGQLVIVAESLVEVQPAQQIPASLAPDAWDELDAMIEQGDYWEMLLPSEFATATPALDALAEELDLRRRDDPLMMLHQLNEQIFNHFEYVPKSTKVDSPIDLALFEAAHPMPLRQRLPASWPQGSRPFSELGDPRVGGGADSSDRVGGVRPDELAGRGRPAHPHRDRARLRGRAADAWDLPRTREQCADRGGTRDT